MTLSSDSLQSRKCSLVHWTGVGPIMVGEGKESEVRQLRFATVRAAFMAAVGILLLFGAWDAGRALAASCSGTGIGDSPGNLICTGSCATGSCIPRNYGNPVQFRYCGCSGQLPDCCFLRNLPADPWWGVAGACDSHCPPNGACELAGDGTEAKPYQAWCNTSP